MEEVSQGGGEKGGRRSSQVGGGAHIMGAEQPLAGESMATSGGWRRLLPVTPAGPYQPSLLPPVGQERR